MIKFFIILLLILIVLTLLDNVEKELDKINQPKIKRQVTIAGWLLLTTFIMILFWR